MNSKTYAFINALKRCMAIYDVSLIDGVIQSKVDNEDGQKDVAVALKVDNEEGQKDVAVALGDLKHALSEIK